MKWTKYIWILFFGLLVNTEIQAQSQGDSSALRFPLPSDGLSTSPLRLGLPPNYTTTVEYDAKTNSYIKLTKVGDVVLRREYMTFEEYQDYHMQQLMHKYWSDKSQTSAFEGGGGLLEKIPGFNEISRKLDALNGKPLISIDPTGSVNLTFKVVNNYNKDPMRTQRDRSRTRPDFDGDIQLNLNAKIGDLMGFDVNLNTQSTFDFENKIKLQWEGKEDDILQLFEAANISFPLNTTLIKGSQQLFGVHTKLKFGKLTVDAVASRKETSTENMRVQGGASSEEFEIRADEYEENRHFFIAQYFYENYNKALSTLPVVGSNIKIIHMEVWRTNGSYGASVTNTRNILALTDLGEYNPRSTQIAGSLNRLPNGATSNNLLQLVNPSQVRNHDRVTSTMQGLGFVSGVDYEKLESARLLNSNEYTYNSQLGFISLNQPLSSDQVLAVAFQYQVIGDTTVYQVGELTTDGVNDPGTLVVKLIKGTSVNPRSPLWKLMMKNVYFLRSTQVSRDNFRFNIIYEDPAGGGNIGFFTSGPKSGLPLIEVFGLDRMDASMNYAYADGVFDWFDSAAYKGGIIQSTTGRIYFPYVEPFGRDLREMIGDEMGDIYCFDSLYTMTQTLARQYADKNKFYLEGYYTSTVSGEISLGYSVTPGSVTVTAGSVPLIENVDYTVDYTMGTVRIINENILASGTPISVSSENNSFSMMSKTMLGLHLNYEFEPNFNLGATVMNLKEKPLTEKNNFGEEPTSNSIYGFDLNYSHEAPLITRLIDRLPGIQTKAPSNLSLQAEFAHFLPGITRVGMAEQGVSYIDDFEGAESSIDLSGPGYWHLASTPQDYNTEHPLFPETSLGTGLAYGFNRALLSWYRIDETFYNNSRPSNISLDDISKPYVRGVSQTEVFPNRSLSTAQISRVYELNLAYYPSERGPYNYDVGSTTFSAGVNNAGFLQNPASRWGGIMRALDYTDFESQNIETIEFWLMDPFMDPETGEHDESRRGGKLYFNLGDISEDILRDGRKSFENGLPTGRTDEDLARNPVDTTIWGRVPKMQSIVNAFSGEDDARKYQDVGYDGLGSTLGLDEEQSFFADYLNSIAVLFGTSSEAYQKAVGDPSSDNFHYFRGSDYDRSEATVLERYKYFSNPEGNSSVEADNSESYMTRASNYPDVEDINKDNTLSEGENYYQYVIDLDPSKMVVGQNYIVDVQEADNVKLANGDIAPTCRWYQFSIPIREPDQVVGNISGFQSIRFMRMFLREFQDPIVLRFASLELVYSTWRKYTADLLQPGDYPPSWGDNTSINISTVNIEENGSREPVPYVMPPGIQREQWYSTGSQYVQLDEKSILLNISDLASGDARAIYRNMQYDLRHFGKLKMFAHAEKKYVNDDLQDDDLVLFVRLGSDYTSNYYEYEVPLKLTPWGTPSTDSLGIWPAENNVELDLQKLVEIKTNRNRKIRNGDIGLSNLELYSEYVDGHKYTVLGSPNLGKVKVIMLGVRNPRSGDVPTTRTRSVIVWFNELRLSDYESKGGWSAMALARANLADIGNFSIYGAYTAAGFGNLEDNLNKMELVNAFNLQTTLNLELGRFFPEAWGLRIPFYIDHTREVGSPEYNPLDQDVLLKEDIQTYQTMAERDSLKLMTQERKSTTNITLTNIRKEKVGKSQLKSHFYDVENFSLSYAYTGERNSDDDIERFAKDQHRGGLTYSYVFPEPGQLKPFDKMKVFQPKGWRIVKDFNLYYQPKNMHFSTEVFRDFEESMLRNKSNARVILRPSYYKQFTWRRTYGLQYDLSRSFHLQYDANANARVDEPIGRIDSRPARDSVWSSILHGGTMQNFQQTLSANWDVPINKVPYLEFLRLPLSYRTVYNYQGTTQALASQGSVVSSTTGYNATLSASFSTLYNKVPLLKKANARRPQQSASNRAKDKDKEKNKVDAKRGLEEKEVDSRVADSLRREELKQRMQNIAFFGLRLATSVKNANLQYNHSSSSQIAGFMGEASIAGHDPSNRWMPGPGFVFGFNTNVVDRLQAYDLLSHDTMMNTPHFNTTNDVLTYQLDVEPLRDMKFALNGTRNYTSREEYYYKYLTDRGYVDGPLSRLLTGNFTSSVWSFRTAFANGDELFARFLSSRDEVARRLADANPSDYSSQMIYDSLAHRDFPGGYSSNSQSVLLTSFLATYLGHDVSRQSFSPFLSLPLPNWNLNYNGLNKVEFLKRWFTNITLAHRYASSYTIGGFYTDAALSTVGSGYDYGSETVLNSNGDYVPPVSMDGVVLNEQFNPLIRLTVSMVNSFQLNLSIQKSRMLQLSFNNNQLTETLRSGVTVGTGYRIKDVKINFKTSERTFNFKSDLVLALNVTYNNNKTVLRRISQNSNQISSGSQIWMVDLSAEYTLMSYLAVRFFIQTNINNPWVQNSYLNATTSGGLTLRLSF